MFKKNITDSLLASGLKTARSVNFIKVQKRLMLLLHEYQAQGLLRKYSVPVPRVIYTNNLG